MARHCAGAIRVKRSANPQIGVRETRRIIGRATLTESDVLGRVMPEDSICECAYPIDIHDPDGEAQAGDALEIFDQSGKVPIGNILGCVGVAVCYVPER